MNMKTGRKNQLKGLIAVLAAITLTACGGGGGDGSIPPLASSNNPPPATGTNPPPATDTSPPPATDTSPPPATDTNPPPATTALSVASTSPANLATDVALNASPSIVFNVKVDPATISSLNPTAFTLRDTTNQTDVGGYVQLDEDGTTATFIPRQNLIPNADYAVTVTTAVKSMEGTSLAENSTWTFTAGGPAVQATYPAADATGVAVNTRVAAVFNVAPAAITSFTLKDEADVPVLGTITYNNDATRTAVFTPTGGNLQADTAYTATVTTATTGSTSWTFNTGTQMDTDKPTATFSPAGNAVNVGVNSAIKVTFNEAIDPSTIVGGEFFVSGESSWLSGNIVFDSATNTVMFFPEEAMLPDTPYHIVVTSNIKDLAGNALDTGSNVELRSDFRTAAP